MGSCIFGPHGIECLQQRGIHIGVGHDIRAVRPTRRRRFRPAPAPWRRIGPAGSTACRDGMSRAASSFPEPRWQGGCRRPQPLRRDYPQCAPDFRKRRVSRPSAARVASRSARAFAFDGRKPQKRKSPSDKPLPTSAEIGAAAPGMGTTTTPAATAAATSRDPGSDTSGVPASDTRRHCAALRRSGAAGPARDCRHCVRCRRLCSVRCRSATAARRWCGCPRTAITSTPASTSSARRVISPRLPIGVATT